MCRLSAVRRIEDSRLETSCLGDGETPGHSDYPGRRLLNLGPDRSPLTGQTCLLLCGGGLEGRGGRGGTSKPGRAFSLRSGPAESSRRGGSSGSTERKTHLFLFSLLRTQRNVMV